MGTIIGLIDAALVSGLFAISFFNTIVLLWLGLTVLLNTENRTIGVYVLGIGLLGGSGFFIAHTALLWFGLSALGPTIDAWWRLGWILVVLMPLAWYGMMLWYSGYWSETGAQLRQRHRLTFIGLIAVACVLLVLVTSQRVLPTYDDVALLNLSDVASIGSMPALFVVFPIFIVACMGLSIVALRHPAPSERLMGDDARERTRPWLLATSLVLLIVAVMVAVFIVWVAQVARLDAFVVGRPLVMIAAIFADLIIASLIGIATVLLGQGIVTYEVFTGRALPRRGFARHWRSLVLLALGYSAVVGGGIGAGVHPVYMLLLTTALMVAFFALFSWRSFVNRENFMAQLRPFVDGQGFLPGLLAGDQASPARRQFEALCRSVLGASRAQLHATGALAPFAGQPLVYPADRQPLPIERIQTQLTDPDSLSTTIEPALYDGYHRVVGLWSQRGMIGLLLLGAKADGGFYTREELEVARASAERIIDMLIGEEVVQRLMGVQQQRHRTVQVLDRRVRRTLHDDILPELHTAVLTLSGLRGDPAADEVLATLSEVHKRISALIQQNSDPVTVDQEATLSAALRDLLDREFDGEFDHVRWQVRGRPRPTDPLALDVMLHAAWEVLRNAAVHGRGGQPDRPLSVDIHLDYTNGTLLTICDDGVGLDHQHPSPGTGSGLELHTTLMTVIGGRLHIEPHTGGGTRATLELA